VSTTDEEKSENVEAETAEEVVSEATPETVAEASADAPSEPVEAAAEEAPAEEAPAEEAPVEEAPVEVAATVEDATNTEAENHDSHHGHSETHFPMDGDEQFDRQLVTEYTQGGHEFDPPMAKGIMAFTGALAFLCVLAGIGVMQLFLAERNAMSAEQAAKIPKDLVQQREINVKELSLARRVEGRNTATVSIQEARKDLLANPGKLNAFVNPPQPPRPAPASPAEKK